jgi:hypothetical protein
MLRERHPDAVIEEVAHRSEREPREHEGGCASGWSLPSRVVARRAPWCAKGAPATAKPPPGVDRLQPVETCRRRRKPRP